MCACVYMCVRMCVRVCVDVYACACVWKVGYTTGAICVICHSWMLWCTYEKFKERQQARPSAGQVQSVHIRTGASHQATCLHPLWLYTSTWTHEWHTHTHTHTHIDGTLAYIWQQVYGAQTMKLRIGSMYVHVTCC